MMSGDNVGAIIRDRLAWLIEERPGDYSMTELQDAAAKAVDETRRNEVLSPATAADAALDALCYTILAVAKMRFEDCADVDPNERKCPKCGSVTKVRGCRSCARRICTECGFSGDYGRTVADADELWDEMISGK
jgi:hypothetical protein